eukprot:scaffold321452_cov17-Tisochrysis_lutea.AAC.1
MERQQEQQLMEAALQRICKLKEQLLPTEHQPADQSHDTTVTDAPVLRIVLALLRAAIGCPQVVSYRASPEELKRACAVGLCFQCCLRGMQVAAEKAEREAAVAAVAKAMEAALVARDVQQACAMEDLQATVKALARTQEQNRLQAETKSGAEAPPAAQPRQQK